MVEMTLIGLVNLLRVRSQENVLRRSSATLGCNSVKVFENVTG